MTKFICILLFLIPSIVSQGQERTSVKPIVGVEIRSSFGWLSSVVSYSGQIGISFNHRLTLMANLATNYKAPSSNPIKGFHYTTASLTAQLRFLKEHHLASPILQLNLGTGFIDRGTKAYFSNNYDFVSYDYATTHNNTEFGIQYSSFRRITKFGSLNIGADISLKNISLQVLFGREFKFIEAEIENKSPQFFELKGSNFVTSLGIIYTLHVKPRG